MLGRYNISSDSRDSGLQSPKYWVTRLHGIWRAAYCSGNLSSRVSYPPLKRKVAILRAMLTGVKFFHYAWSWAFSLP